MIRLFRILPLVLLGICIGEIVACSSLDSNGDESSLDDWQSGVTIAPAEDGQLSSEQRTAYRQDAEKLSIRYINKQDSTQTGIPEPLINLLYNGLIHIVNSGHSEATEATNKYQVHARTPAHPRQIIVYADSSAPWVDAWRNETTTTGNPDVDELINRFDFTLAEFNELAHVLPSVSATLESNRALNVYAVGRLFSKMDDIQSAGPDGVTDGSDIKVLFFDDHLRYTFEYGFGDCPSGCISRHTWRFRVFTDGAVEFAGEEGNPIPDH